MTHSGATHPTPLLGLIRTHHHVLFLYLEEISATAHSPRQDAAFTIFWGGGKDMIGLCGCNTVHTFLCALSPTEHNGTVFSADMPGRVL